jgi:hypothetical protein
MVHVDGDRVRTKFVIKSIEFVFENSLRHDAAKPAHKMLEDGAFAPG